MKKPIALLATLAMFATILLSVLAPGNAAAAPSWTDTGGGLTSTSVLSLAYDNAHNMLYAGTLSGVWRCATPYTTPSWSKITNSSNIGTFKVDALTYDASRDVLYATAVAGTGVADGRGVWMSANPDTAAAWSRITTGADVSTSLLYDVAVDASSRNFLYVSAASGIWRCSTPLLASRNWGGSTIAPSGPRLLEYDIARNFLFFSLSAAADGGTFIVKNPNTGFTLTALLGPGSGPPFLEVSSMTYDSARNRLYAGTVGGNGIFRCATPDTAPAWVNIAGPLGSSTANGLAVDATNNVLYAGLNNNHGVYRSPNPNAASPTWMSTGGGLSAYNVNTLSWDPLHSIYAGMQSHGVWRFGETYVPTWFLAEGSTSWGFSTYISIENPNASAVTADVTYMTSGGEVAGPAVTLPPMSRATVNPADTLGQKDFSTRVRSRDLSKNICVDRTMAWSSGYANGYGYHNSVGVNAPALKWYLPEGSSDWGFECWLLIQNPNATAAICNVTYMIEGEGPVTKAKTIPPNSRQTYNMADDIGAKDASIMVESTNVPIIPERAMYRAGPGMPAGNRREGHDSIGTTEPAADCYLAEGTTAWGFTTYVLIQNPNPTPANVTVTYNTASGPVADAAFAMDPQSRKTIRVNDLHPDVDLSTWVHADKPIIAERAMYWEPSTGTGQAMHDSIGMMAPHKTFYLPDGEVFTEAGDLTETYTLVQNPSSVDVQIRITYLMPSGLGNMTFTDTVPKNTRKTYNMADKLTASTRASVLVQCLTDDGNIMVERAMYFQNRWGGTDTIGGYSD